MKHHLAEKRSYFIIFRHAHGALDRNGGIFTHENRHRFLVMLLIAGVTYACATEYFAGRSLFLIAASLMARLTSAHEYNRTLAHSKFVSAQKDR